MKILIANIEIISIFVHKFQMNIYFFYVDMHKKNLNKKNVYLNPLQKRLLKYFLQKNIY